MEFFHEIPNYTIEVERLKCLLSIASLPELCDSIDQVLLDNNTDGEIYCIWGRFDIRRDEIKQGVRFSLLNCPHALSWTVTLDEQNKCLVIHCTIDKKQQDKDFIDSIHQFVEDWHQGLSTLQNNI